MTVLSALPRATDPSTALIERPDVVVDRGILHLVHDDLAPQQAREADLLLVASVLEEAGIDVLLIRHDRRLPALVVDVSRREAAPVEVST